MKHDWESGVVLYNYHKSAMTQEIEGCPVSSVNGLANSPAVTKFDSVDEDVLQNFSEFALAFWHSY